MNTLQPSSLLNQQLEWLSYGLSRLDKSVPGENNMSGASDDPRDPRDNRLAMAAKRQFLAAIAAQGKSVMTEICHRGNVQAVGKGGRRIPAPGSDALITDQPGVVLQTLYADCCPIVLVDPVHRAVGLAHTSWQSTLDQLAANAVAAMMARYGSKPSEMVAYLGPSICAYHYTKPWSSAERARIDDFVVQTKGLQPAYYWEGDQLHADVVGTNRRLLEYMGVEQVEVSGICTFEREDQPSARRDDPRLGGPFRSNAMAAIAIRS